MGAFAYRSMDVRLGHSCGIGYRRHSWIRLGPVSWRSPACCFCVSRRCGLCFSGTGGSPASVGPNLSSTSAFPCFSLPAEQAKFSMHLEQGLSRSYKGDEVEAWIKTL